MILSINEWIKRYEDKTGDEFVLPAGFQLFWLPNRGFAQYRFYEGMLVVYQLCGDIHFWYDLACLMCIQNGGNAVSTICTCPIKPYLRLLGFEIKEEEDREGKKRYICKDKFGRKVVATYRSTDDTGCDSYFVTSYMDKMYGGING